MLRRDPLWNVWQLEREARLRREREAREEWEMGPRLEETGETLDVWVTEW